MNREVKCERIAERKLRKRGNDNSSGSAKKGSTNDYEKSQGTSAQFCAIGQDEPLVGGLGTVVAVLTLYCGC